MSWPKRFVRPTTSRKGGKVSEGTRAISEASRVKDRKRALEYARRKRAGATSPQAALKAQHDEIAAELAAVVCAICGGVDQNRLNIDHDHKTGLVRGLLCRRCNYAIGLFGDSPQLLEAALAYLRRHEANPGTRRFAGEDAA